MKNGVLKNWLLFAAGIICGIAALILLMAEPNCEGFAECLCVLVASKIGAVVCVIACYWVFDYLTKEVKND